MPKNRTLLMLAVLSLIALVVVTLTVGALGVALFIAGWCLGWRTAS